MGLKNAADVIDQIKKFGKDAEKIIAAETEAIAIQMVSDAKRLAPKNFGKLAQSISYRKIKEFDYEITINAEYGAYLEFGTGTKVQIPPEFADMAASFKGKGRGSFKDGLESIKLWCRSKGIPEEAAYPIFAKILGAGINPQPFLYPAYVKGKKDYFENLKKALGRLNRKI
jgi:HK97 gp10 family phage protein